MVAPINGINLIQTSSINYETALSSKRVREIIEKINKEEEEKKRNNYKRPSWDIYKQQKDNDDIGD